MSIDKINQVLYQPESFYSTTLSSAITASQTTIPVIVAPNITAGYMVLESGTSNKEIIKYTGVSGTTLTGVVRGLATYGTDTSGGTGTAHPAGADIANRDVHYYYAQFYDFLMGTSATGANNMKIGDSGTCSATNRVWEASLSSYTPFWGLSANGTMVVSEDGVTSYVISAGGSGLAAGYGIDITASTINLSSNLTSASINSLTVSAVAVSGLIHENDASYYHYHQQKVYQTTRELSASSGTVNVAHGFTTAPKYVNVTAKLYSSGIYVGSSTVQGQVLESDGYSDGTNQYCTYIGHLAYYGTSPNVYPAQLAGQNATSCVYIQMRRQDTYDDTYRIQSASISLDSTNIIFNWTQTNNGHTPTSCTGNILLTIKAFK